MPITEIMTCALKPGLAIGEPDNLASEVLRETCETISKAPGCEAIWFGMGVESPGTLQMLISQ